MTTNTDPSWSSFEPTPEIPKQRTAWFILLMMIFAVVFAVLMVVGFWLAGGPRFGG